MINKKQKILIIKIGAIGDTIMMSPMLIALKRKYPLHEIIFIGGSIIKPLILAWQVADRFIEVDEKTLFSKNIFFSLVQFLKIWKLLIGKSFEKVFVGHKDWRYSLFSLFSFKKEIIFFNPQAKIPHETEYLKMINLNESSYPIIDSTIDNISPKIRNLMTSSTIVLAPGGAKNYLRDDALRRWPIENYVELAKTLLSKGYDVLLIGEKHDLWTENYFKNVKYNSLIGQTSILELINVIQHSKAFITHDSGPLHLAKLTPTFTIAIFGPTTPIEKIGNGSNIHSLWNNDLTCCPCYDGKNYALCEKNKCLHAIKINDVLNLLFKKLIP